MDSKKPVLIIDTCTDLPYSYIEKHNIPVINFTYHFQGREHIDDFLLAKIPKPSMMQFVPGKCLLLPRSIPMYI